MSRCILASLALAVVLVAGVATPTLADIGLSVGGTTYLKGASSHTQTYSGKLTLVDSTFSSSLGGVAGSPPTAFGAEIHGSISPKLGFQADVVSSQNATFGSTATSLTQVRGADNAGSSRVGETFTLATTTNRGAANYMNFDDSITADLDLKHGLKLDAGGSGCFAGCLSAGFKINLGEGRTNLAALTASGDAYVLGVNVGSSPFSYTDPSNIVTLGGNIPNFDAKSTNVAGGPAVSSRQGLFSASVDVAQAFATAVGLPFALSGDLAGFDYTILSASIGAGLDVVKSFAFETISAGANYVFSAPVSVFNAATSAWSDLTSSWYTSADGSELMVRAPGAATVGVTRYDVLVGNAVTNVDMVGYLSGNLTALGLSGYGLELGPLLNETIKLDIGTVHMGGFSEIATMSQVGQTFNLSFSTNRVDITDLDPCEAGCSISGFIDQRNLIDESDDGYDLSDSRIRLVRNLGYGCAEGLTDYCDFDDENFAPILRQVYLDTTGQNDGVSGEDIREFRASLAAPDFLALQSDDAQVLNRLRALGLDPLNPRPFRGMGPGASFPTDPILESRYSELSFTGPGVPEPSTWVMLIGGLMLVGTALRRRRPKAALA